MKQTITILPTQSGSSGTPPVLLHGVITQVTDDSSGNVTSFVIQGLTISVGSATISGSSTTLAVGEDVVVAATASSDNTLTATKILIGGSHTFAHGPYACPISMCRRACCQSRVTST